MATCKGCKTVFNVNDMTDGYCEDCIKTVDKEYVKDVHTAEISKVVNLIGLDGSKKEIKLGYSPLYYLLVEVYLFSLKEWGKFILFLILKIFLVFSLLIYMIDQSFLILLPSIISCFLFEKVSKKYYLKSLLNKGFKPLTNADKLILDRLKVTQ